MELSSDEVNRALEWFHAVQDLNPAYLEPEDYDLAQRLRDAATSETRPPTKKY